jgi:uncharacterized protein (DUF849 family)
LPYTPGQIIDDAVRAANAGATVVHVHARDPKDGRPSSDIGLLEEITQGIHERCDAAICVTTGGGLGMSPRERVAPIRTLKPELASLNSGSINFAIYGLAGKLKNPKFEWERPYLLATEDLIFANTFKTHKLYAEAMSEVGTKPELEVCDLGMINNVKHLIDAGVLKTPVYMQFVLGILGGIPATPANSSCWSKLQPASSARAISAGRAARPAGRSSG